VTIPLRQLRRLRDLLLASLTGGEGELGLAADMAAIAGERERREGGGNEQEGEEMVDVEALLGQLGLLGGDGLGGEGGGGPGGASKGLTDEEVALLPRSTLQKTSTLLLACTLTLAPTAAHPAPVEMAAIPGDFSPVPPGDPLELVAGEPLTADTPSGAFANAGALRGRVVVVQRGRQTFGKMVLMARAAGARGVCVVNSVSLWPYLMKDTAGEARAGVSAEANADADADSAGGSSGSSSGAGWFIVMVPQREGQALLARLTAGAAGAGAGPGVEPPVVVVPATMAVTSVEKDCVICVDAFQEGEEVVRLPPCGHGFHAQCLQRWLKLARTCPYCRSEVRVRRG
jgi:hypothetical protein